MISVKVNSGTSLSFVYSISKCSIVQVNNKLKELLNKAQIDLNTFSLDVAPYITQEDKIIELSFNGVTIDFSVLKVGDMILAQGQEVTSLDKVGVSSNKSVLSSEDLHRMRLLTLGELTSGIVHDINNALGMSVSALELFKEDIKELSLFVQNKDAEVVELFESISKQADHLDKGFSLITQIAEGVRAFTHKNQVEFKVQDVMQIIKSSHVFSKNFLDKSKIKLTVSDHLPLFIACKESLLTQVFVNMIKNSHDAIENLPFHKKWIQIDVSDTPQFVIIDISDGGSGIPENLHDHIFKPFYTTKEVGKGTGLGLSMCNNILEAHGGKIEINKNVKNTSFRLYISKKLA